MTNYMKSSAIVIGGLLVLYLAVGAILAVVNVVTWDGYSDWALKGALVALIVAATNVVIGLLTTLGHKQ